LPGAFPIWTPDGQGVVFFGFESNGVYLRPVDRGGAPEPLFSETAGTPGGADEWPSAWINDHTLVIVRQAQDGRFAICSLDLRQPDGERTVLVDGGTQGVPWSAAVSPDGRLLAYQSTESGRTEVYVRWLRDGGRVVKVSRDGGRHPVWRPDGRELFFVKGRFLASQQMMAVDVHLGATDPLGTPKVLCELPSDVRTTSSQQSYDVTRDGQRFLFVRDLRRDVPPPPSEMRVILNWFDELKAKVPTR